MQILNFKRFGALLATIFATGLLVLNPAGAKADFFEDLFCFDPIANALFCDDDNGGSSNNNNGGGNQNPVPLDATCYATRSSIDEGESVTWKASAWGGPEASYRFTWAGTDGLSGNGSAISKVYFDAGTKVAYVTVESGNQQITRSCTDSVLVRDDNNNNNDDDDDDYSDLRVSCDADTNRAEIDERVEWRATARGGDGDYEYDWSGSEGLRGDDREVSIRYEYEGRKTARVTVYSDDGQSETEECDDDVEVEDDDYYNDNYNRSSSRNALSAYCEANTTSTITGSTVTWKVRATGGTGRYTYDWSGTSGISGTGDTLYARYYNPGLQTANVLVKSGSAEFMTHCRNTVNVISNTPIVQSQQAPIVIQAPTVTRTVARTTSRGLDATCVANTQVAKAGDSVVWTVSVTGGNDSYSYAWTGSDGLYSLNNTAYKVYNREGDKIAAVTVTSGNESITRTCLQPVTVLEDDGSSDGDDLAAALFGALGNVSWGMLSLFIIFALLAYIGYLHFSKKEEDKH